MDVTDDTAPFPAAPAAAAIDYGASVLALGTNAPEARRAFRTLSEATSVLLETSGEDALDLLLGPDEAPAMRAALDLVPPTVRRAATGLTQSDAGPGPLAAAGERIADEPCWPGARVSPDMMPPILFWLDLLSVSEDVGLEDLITANRGLVLEVALSPTRVDACLSAMGGDLADLADASVYLAEAARNPTCIAFLTRALVEARTPREIAPARDRRRARALGRHGAHADQDHPRQDRHARAVGIGARVPRHDGHRGRDGGHARGGGRL